MNSTCIMLCMPTWNSIFKCHHVLSSFEKITCYSLIFGCKLPAKTEKHEKLHALIAQANQQHMSTRNSSQKVCKPFHSATPCKKILLIPEAETGSRFGSLTQLLLSLLLLVVKSLLLAMVTPITEKRKTYTRGNKTHHAVHFGRGWACSLLP